MKVFVINGSGTCGKDTFIEIFEKYHDHTENISSIDPIKDIARENGWSGTKTEKDRKFLSDLKRVFIEYNDLPTKFLVCHWKDDHYEDTVLFMHIREPYEIDKIKLIIPNIKTILINKDTGKHGNPSDDDVYDYTYDYIIDNNGSLEDLQESVKIFINEIL